ncbi:MAG: Transmembrane emp24 domain-containing protein 10 [Cercozoa sp. M6MM]
MQSREERMRTTNESTNTRVLWFSVFSMLALGALSVWQIYFLRDFFRRKKMI